jgi:hypothetical protein
MKFALVIAWLYSILVSWWKWAGYLAAKSPECDNFTNSIQTCDSSDYLTEAIVYSLISLALFTAIVVVVRKELINKKTN